MKTEPRLAHQNDWYLQRQLKNFQSGVRGRHPQDFSGAQMAAFSRSLHDERETADLVAYIGTLRGELSYEIFVFSPVTGLLETPRDGDPLSANVVAIPSERVADTTSCSA